MMDFNYQIVFTVCQIFKIASSTSLKSMKLTTIPPIYVCINKSDNRLVFKMKYGYKIELQMTETMKLFGSTKKLIGKTRFLDSLIVTE